MWLIGIALFATACHRADRTLLPIEPRPAQPQLQKYVEPLARPGFSGRVFNRSEPVTHFGVAVVRDVTRSPRITFQEVHSVDGYFHVPSEPGIWDVVIVASGFPRKVLQRRAIEELRSTDLGVIELPRSFVTQGDVRDVDGKPVADAVISIIQNHFAPTDGSFTAMANGNFRTTTDASGHYVVRGVTTLDLTGGQPRLFAEHGRRRSHPVRVPTGDATIDVIVHPLGTVEGIAQNAVDGARVMVWSVHERQGLYMTRFQNHRFTLEVPAGDYVIAGSGSRKQLTVPPDSTATVTLP